MHYLSTAMVIVFFLFIGCQGDEKAKTEKEGETKMEIKITSPAFAEGEMIPVEFSCDGDDISPALNFESIPEETRSIAVISDDPDAPMGTWVHWVLFNLPPETRRLAENIPADEVLDNGARHGITDFGRFGYGGPCPPGGTHRYFFKVYALDKMLEISGRITKLDLMTDMEGHILAQGQLMGKYQRQ